jgi:regulator of nucleoside diphosphate kinase
LLPKAEQYFRNAERSNGAARVIALRIVSHGKRSGAVDVVYPAHARRQYAPLLRFAAIRVRSFAMPMTGAVWLTEQDYNRLKHLLADLTRQSRGMQRGVDTLEEILDLARVVDSETVPANVVTMNSRVLFEDVRTSEAGTVTIVYPGEANPSEARISVLSPMGMALLGEPEGRELELPLPHGQSRRIRIASVLYQPEARGDYAL